MDFERLSERHRDAVYRQLYRMCGNHEDAEDVLVESLLKAYRFMGSLQSEESFRAWLAQIARRTCGRLKRREQMHPVLELANLEAKGLEPLDPSANPEELAAEAELKSCVISAFNRLPAIYREVYQLRDVEGKSADEAAAALGITIAAVKSRLHRARALVRNAIDLELNPVHP